MATPDVTCRGVQVQFQPVQVLKQQRGGVTQDFERLTSLKHFLTHPQISERFCTFYACLQKSTFSVCRLPLSINILTEIAILRTDNAHTLCSLSDFLYMLPNGICDF